ncbi:hypothetical protein ACFSYD_16250 [Paracoccus aerius]
MAWAGTGIGRLGLWWQARRAGVPDGAAPPDIPPGGGPLLLVQVSPMPARPLPRCSAA